MHKTFFKSFRGYAFLSIAFVVLISPLISGYEYAISWDTVGYYWYLPQHFIYGAKLNNLDTLELLRQKYDLCANIYQFNQEANGIWVNRYTLGQSIFQFPFFIVGHVTALLFGYEPDGFSSPYLIAQIIGNVFYFLSAIYLLAQLLHHYVSDKTVAISIFILFFGTNLLFNYTHQTWYCSTHNYLFAGLVYMFYLLHTCTHNFKFKTGVLLGFILACIILARPASAAVILILVFPLQQFLNRDLVRLSSSKPFFNKPITLRQAQGDQFSDNSRIKIHENKFVIKNEFRLNKYILSILIGAFVPFAIQLLYWKTNSGEWIYFGYKNPAEGFDFPGKYIIKNLFYFRKGWLIYTPLMIFAITGFYFLYKRNKILFWTITPYFIVNVLIISSWSVWWWSESYGHRAMLESYALLVFPLAFFTERMISKKSVVFICVIVVFIGLNVFKVWQYSKGIINPNRMTRAYYFSTFFSLTKNDQLDTLLVFDRNKNKEPLALNKYRKLPVFNADSIQLNTRFEYLFGKKICFKDYAVNDYFYYRAEFDFQTTDSLYKPQLVFYTEHKGVGYQYQGQNLSIGKNTIYYLSPEVRDEKDSIVYYFYNVGKGRGVVKDFKLEVLNKK